MRLEELKEPTGGVPASTYSNLLKKSSGTSHQYTSQHFIASAGDHTKPDFACGRMISGRQTDPGGKITPGLKHRRVRGLHHQKRGTDRADTGDFGQALAALIRTMQGHQFFIDGFDLGK